MALSGIGGFGSLNSYANQLAQQIENVGAEVSRIIRDYNQKTNEEVAAGNKISDIKRKDETMQRLTALEKQLLLVKLHII